MKKLFEKSEILYLLLSLVGTGLLVFAILNSNINNYISSLNPILQFLILNLGMYIVFLLFFKGIALKKRHMWRGVLGTLLGFMAFDLILPEYHVGINGLVTGGIFGKSASDYFFGYIYSQLGFSGTFLVILVYPMTFLMLFIIGAILIKNFVKKL